MQRIGYRGALDIGFRYDRRDGRYKVNDVNPRVGSMFRVFVGSNGMDIVRALYLDLTNQPVISSSPKEGRKWIVEDAARGLILSRKSSTGPTLRPPPARLPAHHSQRSSESF